MIMTRKIIIIGMWGLGFTRLACLVDQDDVFTMVRIDYDQNHCDYCDFDDYIYYDGYDDFDDFYDDEEEDV